MEFEGRETRENTWGGVQLFFVDFKEGDGKKPINKQIETDERERGRRRGGLTEVNYSKLTLCIDEDIVWLEISMEHSRLVKEIDATKNLKHKILYMLRTQCRLRPK